MTRVEFTCIATWLPYKTACVSIINVLVIVSLASFVKEKVSTWVQEIDLLLDISIIHLDTAYAAFFTHGFT